MGYEDASRKDQHTLNRLILARHFIIPLYNDPNHTKTHALLDNRAIAPTCTETSLTMENPIFDTGEKILLGDPNGDFWFNTRDAMQIRQRYGPP